MCSVAGKQFKKKSNVAVSSTECWSPEATMYLTGVSSLDICEESTRREGIKEKQEPVSSKALNSHLPVFQEET